MSLRPAEPGRSLYTSKTELLVALAAGVGARAAELTRRHILNALPDRGAQPD